MGPFDRARGEGLDGRGGHGPKGDWEALAEPQKWQVGTSTHFSSQRRARAFGPVRASALAVPFIAQPCNICIRNGMYLGLILLFMLIEARNGR